MGVMGRWMVEGFLLLTFLVCVTNCSNNINDTTTTTSSVVSPFCTIGDPESYGRKDYDKALCTRLVTSAQNWEQALVSALKGVIEIANATKPTALQTIQAKLPRGLAPHLKRSINTTCSDTFDHYVGFMQECVELMEKKDDPYMYSAISTYFVMTLFGDCQQALLQHRTSLPEVDQFDKFNGMLLSIYYKMPKN